MDCFNALSKLSRKVSCFANTTIILNFKAFILACCAIKSKYLCFLFCYTEIHPIFLSHTVYGTLIKKVTTDPAKEDDC